MIQRVIFRPEAVGDVTEAAAWYDERSFGLGGELIDEILRASDRAARNPDSFRIVRPQGNIRRIRNGPFSLPDIFLCGERNALRACRLARRTA